MNMNRLNTIHNIIYSNLRPWHRDNLMKPDEYWKEKTVDTKKETPFNKSQIGRASCRERV